MKRCFKCAQELSPQDFYRHPKMKDGRLNKCKKCTKLDVTNHRQNNLEKTREYDRNRASLPHRIKARKTYSKSIRGQISERKAKINWTLRNPHKKRATQMVNNALRNGKLLRQGCVKCGHVAEAHHEDYSKPLEVVWLCDFHHKERHKELRRTARASILSFKRPS